MELEIRRQEFLGGVHEVTPEEMAALVGAKGRHIIEKPLQTEEIEKEGYADILQMEGNRMVFNPAGPDPLNLRGYEISMPPPEQADKLGFAFGGQPVIYDEAPPLPVIGFELPGGLRYNVLEDMGLEVQKLSDGRLVPRLPAQLRSAPPTNRPPRLTTEPRTSEYSGFVIEELPPQAATTAAYMPRDLVRYNTQTHVPTAGATLPRPPAVNSQAHIPSPQEVPYSSPAKRVARRRTDPAEAEAAARAREVAHGRAVSPNRRAGSPNGHNRREKPTRRADFTNHARNPMCGADFFRYTALASQALEQTQGWLKAMSAPQPPIHQQIQTRSVEEEAAAKALRRKERRLRRERKAAATAAATAPRGRTTVATAQPESHGVRRVPSDEAVQKMICLRRGEQHPNTVSRVSPRVPLRGHGLLYQEVPEMPVSARDSAPPATPRLPKQHDFALPLDRSALPEILQQACDNPGTIQLRQPVAVSGGDYEAQGSTAIPTLLERPKVLHRQLAEGLSIAEIERAKQEAIVEGRVPMRGQVGLMTANDQLRFAAQAKDGETETKLKLAEAEAKAEARAMAQLHPTTGATTTLQAWTDREAMQSPKRSVQGYGAFGQAGPVSIDEGVSLKGRNGAIHRQVTASAEAGPLRTTSRAVDLDPMRARSTSPTRPNIKERIFEVATSTGTRTIELVTLNEAPRVELFRNFLTEEECDRLVALIDQIEAAPDNPNNLLVNDGGIDEKSRLYIDKIVRRMAALTGLDEEEFAGVCPSVVRLTAMDATKDFSHIIRLYLDDEEEECQSDFPFLGISVCPRRGTAIRWQTKNEKGFKLTRATHSESVGEEQQRRLLTAYVR